jgi:penicillin-binding protein 1A
MGQVHGGPGHWVRLGGWLVLAVAVLAACLPARSRAADILGCRFSDAAELVRLTRLPGYRLLDITDNFAAGLGNYCAPPVPVENLPRHLINALVTSEDRRFYEHGGIDWQGVLRAVVVNAQSGSLRQGGSTLTQQVLKNTCFRDDDGVVRKLKELLSVRKLEHALDKDAILEVYLNSIPFGGTGVAIRGIQAAARVYFGKYAQELTPLESAVLVQLIPAPNRYNPHVAPKLARERAVRLLDRMVEAGRLSPALARKGKGQALKLAPAVTGLPGFYPSGPQLGWLAQWARRESERLVGRPEGVVTLATTLRPRIQRAAERALGDVLRRHGQAAQVDQGAVVVLSYTGDVLAMVGGRDFRALQWNNATQARRQPGSAFKPFVYLAALERGLAPADTVQDKPLELRATTIRNDDEIYRGRISLGRALAVSSNPAAVRLAIGHVGEIAGVAKRLGIESPLTREVGLALGDSEVTLLELTAACAAIANGGRKVVPSILRSVRDNLDQMIWCREPARYDRVIELAHDAAIKGMLQLAVTEGTGRRADPGFPAFGKTGTTNDSRDAWFIGFTSRFVVGVWMGNEDSSPTRGIVGGGLPAEVWRRTVVEAHREPVVPAVGCPASRA